MKPELLRKSVDQLFQDKPSSEELTTQLYEFVQSHQAADVTKITRDEYQATVRGLDALISRLKKISKTLNEQDEARNTIEREADLLNQLKGAIANSYEGLRQIQV
jgi:hypothetical protein